MADLSDSAHRLNLVAAYRNSTIPLRLTAIRLALTLRGDHGAERLNFMADHRYHELACRRAETHGQDEALTSVLDLIQTSQDHKLPMAALAAQVQVLHDSNSHAAVRLGNDYLARRWPFE